MATSSVNSFLIKSDKIEPDTGTPNERFDRNINMEKIKSDNYTVDKATSNAENAHGVGAATSFVITNFEKQMP